MVRRMLLGGMVSVFCMAVPTLAEDCTGCKEITAKGFGFCDKCKHGVAFGVDLTSKKLYEALAGQEVKDAAAVKCPGCQTALKTSGVCDHCKLGAANGQLYHSMVAYRLAKGEPTTAEKAAHCPQCKKAFETGGWCSGCNMGYAGHRMFKDKAGFEAAKKAHEILASAAKASAKCEGCAAAMVQDGQCEKCKLTYKDGKAQQG